MTAPAQILRGILDARKQKNAAYSISALARDAGVSQPLLSLILHGKRPLTLPQAKKMSILLNLKKDEEKELINAAIMKSSKNAMLKRKLESEIKENEEAKLKEVEIEKFTTIAKWYHLPILAMISTKGFKNDTGWISKRLNITPIEARDALERLKRLGLVIEENGILREADLRIEFTPKRSEEAVREHHNQMMSRAREEMTEHTDEDSWKNRDISSLSMSVDPARVGEAKELIKKFKQDLLQLMGNGSPTEVYQINMQLFPLTRSKK